MEIYNTLYAMLINPHVLCPPPTEIAFTMLRTAFMRDQNVKVRNCCGFILQNLEKVIHPQKESLVFPSDPQTIRNTFIKFGQERLLSDNIMSTEIKGGINGYDSESHVINDNILCAESIHFIQTETPLPNNNLIHRSITTESCNESLLENDALHNETEAGLHTNVDVTHPSSEINAYNDKLLNQEKTKNDEISIITQGDVSQKSLNMALRVNECETVRDVDTKLLELIDEPILKKPKIDDEIGNKTINNVCDFGIDKDEDTIVADIASQFVDELD